MRRKTLVCAAALVQLAAACDGPGVVRPGGPTVGVGGPTALANALVGSWQRILYFFDDFGYARASETHWQFGSDGTAIRAVIARNFTTGISDVTLATARWRVEGTTIRIDFITPSPGTIQLDARVQGDTLYLAGQAYARGTSP